MFDRFIPMLERLGAYPWWQVGLELLVIWAVVFAVVRFVQGTRAAGALKTVVLVMVVGALLVRVLGNREAFQRLAFLYENFLTIAAVALIVIFQPELRRGLTRLGGTPLFRRATPLLGEVVEAIVESAGYLRKAKFGAIIVIERQVPLKGLVEGGTPIHGAVTAPLLQTIFFPGTALHDLAVVVSRGEVAAAGVQLPLADPEDMPDAGLGSRHRAAVGLTQECDALAVVVSEETGIISVAERGRLTRGLSADELRDYLTRALRSAPTPVAPAAAAPEGGAPDDFAGADGLAGAEHGLDGAAPARGAGPGASESAGRATAVP